MTNTNWIKKIKIYNKLGLNIIDKIENEINLQNSASKYDFTPKIISTSLNNDYYYLEMENLNMDCIANIYGEEPTDIPDYFWSQMKNIIRILYEEEQIEYIDITPYNFIEKNDKIYLIDFGHAFKTTSVKIPSNWFLRRFLDQTKNVKEYNPDFK